MSSFDDAIWRHLVDRHGADRVEVPAPTVTRRVRPFAASAAIGGSAAAIAAVVLVLGGTTATPAAYALTPNGDGTYTVSLNNLATGIPALNAKFKDLGIRETVIPIEANCAESELFGPFAYPGASMSEKVTVGNKWLAPGQRGFLAAKQMPDGKVLLAIGSSANPLPPCFPEKPNNATIIPHSS
jgi:hypothetical protein